MAPAALACVALLGFLQVPTAPRRAGVARSLAQTVREFNLRASEVSIGRRQPPLTEEEVVSAIRWMGVDRPAGARDEEVRALQDVARTRRLPTGVELEVLTGFEPDDRTVFKAWSVRIVLPKPDGGTHAFIIRDRWISSRSIGPEEHKVIRRWEERWRKQGGMASFDHPIYEKERAEAAVRDRQSRL